MIDAIENAAKLLIDHNLTIAFAESATAGRVSGDFSLVCNAGKFLKGGLVCYDAELKINILKVSQELLEKFTPESMEVTQAISIGLSTLIKADLHIGITGLPCSGGSETIDKPVGTMFVFCLYNGNYFFKKRLQLSGNHQEIVSQTVEHIAILLINNILGANANN